MLLRESKDVDMNRKCKLIPGMSNKSKSCVHSSTKVLSVTTRGHLFTDFFIHLFIAIMTLMLHI